MAPWRSPELGRIHLRGLGVFRVAKGLSPGGLEALLRAHADPEDPARVLKSKSDRRITRVPVPAGELGLDEVVVKELRIPLARRWLHLLGLPSRFSRDPAGIQRLLDLGISSPLFVAASLAPRGGREFLVTEYVKGCVSLRDLLWSGTRSAQDTGGLTSLLSCLGSWLRGVHESGIWHRDLKPGNILVRSPGPGPYEMLLIDTTDVRFLSAPPREERRVRNLCQLLDLPARMDSVARRPLLEAYLDAGRAREDEVPLARLESLVGRSIEARRARRKRRTGVLYVDEEDARPASQAG